MTDLEKAKQWLDGEIAKSAECPNVQAFMTMSHTYLAHVLVAYASHSNSELLERVQKLEQAHRDILNERYTELDMMRCEFPGGTSENDAWHKGVYEAWRTFNNVKDISRKSLAKAPDTRNV